MAAGFELYLSAIALRAFGALLPLPFGTSFMSLGKRIFASVVVALLFGWRDSSVVLSLRPGLWLLGEIGVGVLLSLPIAIGIACARMFGEFFEVSRGQSLGSLFEFHGEAPTSPLPTLFGELLFALLILEPLFPDLVAAFIVILDRLPPGAVSLPAVATHSSGILALHSHLFISTVLALLPLLLVFAVVDLCLGFLVLHLPSLHLQSESFQIKTLVGFGLLLASAQSGLPSYVSRSFRGFLNHSFELVTS